MLTTLTLLCCIAPAALAGGLHATIEGPDAQGLYTARTFACDPTTTLEPWAIAEGLVDNRRESVLIRLEPTEEHGVYTFPRTWGKEGRWMIRLALGHPPAPATVATLASNGSVTSSKLHFNTDGGDVCNRALKPKGKSAGNRTAAKNPDDGC
jgi:hypothetical protein